MLPHKFDYLLVQLFDLIAAFKLLICGHLEFKLELKLMLSRPVACDTHTAWRQGWLAKVGTLLRCPCTRHECVRLVGRWLSWAIPMHAKAGFLRWLLIPCCRLPLTYEAEFVLQIHHH